MFVKIEIKRTVFNEEYHADITLSPENTKYIASDNLDELMNTVKQRVLEFNNE